MDRVGEGFGIVPTERDGVLRSDGTTILAADDVSGICAILEGLRQSISCGRPLPRLEVLFTVSEEVGLLGAKQMDASRFQSKIGLFFDSSGPTGRIINTAPGMYFLARRACGAVGLKCLDEPGGGGMDANVFNARGISSVGIATGYYKNHTKEEYLVMEDFYRTGELAAAMIQLYGETD